MVNKGFQSEVITIGICPVGGEIGGTFFYNGPIEDIEDISLGCGSCTTLHDKYEEEGVTVIPFSYKDNHVVNQGLRSKYPSGVINVQKTMTVLFNDGQEKFVQSEDGLSKTRNQNKEQVILTYRVDVKF